MNTPNYSTKLRFKMLSSFFIAIASEITNRDDHDYNAQLADEAWSLALDCGYDYLNDKVFLAWAHNDVNATREEILMAGLQNALQTSEECS